MTLGNWEEDEDELRKYAMVTLEEELYGDRNALPLPSSRICGEITFLQTNFH
jgi:hypothetical protein